MTVQLETQQTPRVDMQQIVDEAAAKLQPGRAAALLGLLSTHDFVEAVDSGLVDRFHYDPETGEDAIVHILAGNHKTGPDGALIPGGFHHAPSADLLWPGGMTQALDQPHATDFEPYRSRIEIGGLAKRALATDDHGEVHLVDQKNGMFPLAYDGYAVLKAVDIAARTRDRTKDATSEHLGQGERLRNKGSAPLIDGKSPMPIQLVMRPATATEPERIITAFPSLTRRKQSWFTKDQIPGYIYGDAGLEKRQSS